MAAVQLAWSATASAAAPTVVTRGQRICQLTGDAPDGGIRSNWTRTRNGLYGTDLGYTVSYRGRIYFFFGDTWTSTPSGGGAPVTPRASDDAISSAWRFGGSGDFNSDGRWDMVWHNGSQRDVVTWMMQGAAVTEAGILSSFIGSNWEIVGVLSNEP